MAPDMTAAVMICVRASIRQGREEERGEGERERTANVSWKKE
jgi:hypothetical protein